MYTEYMLKYILNILIYIIYKYILKLMMDVLF